MECGDCGVHYVRKHTCKAGTCGLCGVVFRSRHTCAVEKYDTFRGVDETDFQQAGFYCEVCGDHHPHVKNINGKKEWKGIVMCSDCYCIPEIQAEVSMANTVVRLYDVSKGKTHCRYCRRGILDPYTLETLYRFERDHIDPGEKIDSVGHMLLIGTRMSTVLEEVDKCRNLCVRCHSVQTFVERKSGIIGRHAHLLSLEKRKDLLDTIHREVLRLLGEK